MKGWKVGGEGKKRRNDGNIYIDYEERRVLSLAQLKPVGLHEDIKVVHRGCKYRCIEQQQWDALYS
jgi:hypothetical protein